VQRNIGVLISGRGSNLQAIIDAVGDGRLDARIALVISNRPAAYGLERARAAGVETLVRDHKGWPSREAYEAVLVDDLRARNVELVCLAGSCGCSARPSLARSRTGFSTSTRAPAVISRPARATPGSRARVRFSGATVHIVDTNLDAGPIVLQAVVPVFTDDTEDTLSARILAEEHRIYPDAVQRILDGGWRLEGRRLVFT